MTTGCSSHPHTPRGHVLRRTCLEWALATRRSRKRHCRSDSEDADVGRLEPPRGRRRYGRQVGSEVTDFEGDGEQARVDLRAPGARGARGLSTRLESRSSPVRGALQQVRQGAGRQTGVDLRSTVRHQRHLAIDMRVRAKDGVTSLHRRPIRSGTPSAWPAKQTFWMRFLHSRRRRAALGDRSPPG